MDLENLTVEELEKLSKDAAAAALKKRERQKKDMRAQIEATVKAAGFHLDDIFYEMRGHEMRPTVMAHYRDPDNPENTWTGQGRRPKWLVAALAGERELEDFKIQH